MAALGAATAAERAALGGAAAPPEGSRAQFWAALAALGRERAAAVFEAHPAHCAELLAAATRTDPPLLTPSRLTAEARLGTLRRAARAAAAGAAGAAALQQLHMLVAPPARFRGINALDAAGGFALHAAARDRGRAR